MGLPVAQLLVSPEAVRVRNNRGEVSLHLACKGCDDVIMQHLLDVDIEQLWVSDYDGYHPLHYACMLSPRGMLSSATVRRIVQFYPAALVQPCRS